MSKLNNKTSLIKMVEIMCEKRDELVDLIMKIVWEANYPANIEMLDSYGIRGKKLAILWEDCCNSDYEIFKTTIMLLMSKIFTQEEINIALDEEHKIPFLSAYLNMEKDVWVVFCHKQKENFKAKLVNIDSSKNKIFIKDNKGAVK